MSSSSSESISYDCRTAGMLYPDLRHPLIYNAQVQYKDIPKCTGFNCFTNAYQWYNQEYMPRKKKSKPKKRDVKRFAAWLDEKYVEYLRENESESNVKRTLKTGNVHEHEVQECSEKCPRKKKKRFRSPWRKRKNTASNEGSIILMDSKTLNSVKTILKPKKMSRTLSECGGSSSPSVKTIFKTTNISRTVSEWCQSTKTEPCCTKPMCLLDPNDMGQSIQQARESKSTCSFLHGREVEIDVPMINEDTTNKEYVWVPVEVIRAYETEARLRKAAFYEDFHLPVEMEKIQKSNKNTDSAAAGKEYQNVQYKDVVCQCFTLNKRRDTSSQYIHDFNKTSLNKRRDTSSQYIHDFNKTSQKQSQNLCACPVDKSAAVSKDLRNEKDKEKGKSTNNKPQPNNSPEISKQMVNISPDRTTKQAIHDLPAPLIQRSVQTSDNPEITDSPNEKHQGKGNSNNIKMQPQNYSPDIFKQIAINPEITTKQAINDFPLSLNNSVQTSDHPLNIGSPLYMKIYFPEKPNDFENTH